MLKLTIISGGQTGADQGALAAAKVLNLPTTGYMPRGFMTEIGSKPHLAREFHLSEHTSSRYPPRTQNNVLLSNGVLLFGHLDSPGTALTKYYAQQYKVPFFTKLWTHLQGYSQLPDQQFLTWLSENRVDKLLVAGNRESDNPGIHYATKFYLIVNLERLAKDLTPITSTPTKGTC